VAGVIDRAGPRLSSWRRVARVSAARRAPRGPLRRRRGVIDAAAKRAVLITCLADADAIRTLTWSSSGAAVSSMGRFPGGARLRSIAPSLLVIRAWSCDRTTPTRSSRPSRVRTASTRSSPIRSTPLRARRRTGARTTGRQRGSSRPRGR
jgi:hypothetical protein